MKKYVLASIFAIGLTMFLIHFMSKKFNPKNELTALKHLHPGEQYFLGRNYPAIGDGEIAYSKAVDRALFLKKKYRNQNTPWTLEGPTNIGGRINSIAIHPTNSSIIYIATPNAGIFKTTNGGTTWTQIFTNENTLAIGVIAIDPTNPNTIYAGTGDNALSSFTYLGNGIYKSTDAGNTWTNIGLNQYGVVTKIEIDPTNPSTIYVGTMGNIYTQNSARGLYKTSNGGSTWNQILYLGNDAGIGDMTMDKSHPDTIFVTGRNRFRSNSVSYVIGSAAKIYRTYNGGTNWDTLTNGLPIGDQCKITLALSQNNPQLIYASYCDTSSNYSGFYKSTNGGNNWTFMSQDPSMSLGGFGWYFGEIRIDPNNDNKIHWMGVDLFSSSNGGQTWSINSPPWYTYEVHADKHDLQFINSNTFLLATDGGLYRTTTGGGQNGNNWNFISEIPNTQFYKIGYNPFDSLNYFGGAQDNGTEGGSQQIGINAWSKYFGGDGFMPAFDTSDPDIFYTQTQNGNINATDDGGFNFNNITQSLTSTDRTNWNTPYILSKHSPLTMYVGTYQIYKNNYSLADNWTPISNDLTDGTNNQHHTISAIDQSNFSIQIIYAGTSDGKVWVTQNEGTTWTLINTGLPNRYVSSIKASPNNQASAFVSYWGYRDNDTTAYIYYTNNYGSTWTSIASNTLPNFAINDIWIKPNSNDSSILIANDGGVYSTINRGATWMRVGNNMPILPVYDVEYNPVTKKIFAGTFAISMQSMSIDSVFEITKPVVHTDINNLLLNPSSVYPNPCINYVIIEPSFIENYTLTLINAKGQIISKVENCKGKYQLDLSQNTSGIYFLEIKSGAKKEIKKLYKK